MTNDTLSQKLKLLENKETQLAASISNGEAQIKQLEAQVTNLQDERKAVFGARLMIQELLSDIAQEAPASDSPALASIEAMPTT